MDPLRIYDYLVIARGRVLDWVRPFAADGYTREFPIGKGTLARTLTHIMTSEWYYVQRMRGEPVPPDDQWPIREEEPPALWTLEAAWVEQAGATRAAVAAVRDWTAPIEYRVDYDGKSIVVTASADDIFTQLVLHEVHHRAQAMNMLRHLGVTVDDIDFNALMYTRRPA